MVDLSESFTVLVYPADGGSVSVRARWDDGTEVRASARFVVNRWTTLLVALQKLAMEIHEHLLRDEAA